MESIEFYSDEEIQGEETYQVMSDVEDNYGSISWHHNDHSDSESRDEPGREAPEPEPPDSYNTNTGYSIPWIKFNDDFCSHGSKSPLTRAMSFSEKKNYLKWEDDMEYKGATAKEYNCQRLPRHEEKLDHHTLLYRGPTASRQAKLRHKFFHTNTRVVQEVTQEVTQRSSMWRKPYPRGRRDYLAERDSGITNLRGGELKRGTRRDPLLSNPTRTYQTKLRLSLDNGYEYFGPESFEFAGRERDYLQWELNMDKYFRYYSIPKEERLNYCLEQLMGSAKRWWDREEKDRRWFKEPALKTWGQLKILMRERYAPHSFPQPGQHTYHPKEPSRENTTHQRVSSNQIADQDPAKKNEKGTCAKGEPSSIPVLETHAEPHVETHAEPHVEPHAELKQGMSYDSLKSNEPTCYRCHKKGHFAATCYKRQVEDVTSLELKLNASNSNDCLVNSSLEIPNSRLMRLSLPKVIDAGLCHSMDDTSKEVDHNVATLKEVENIISFEEQLSETTTSTQVCRNKTYDQAALKGRVIIQPCSTPADLTSKIIHIKVALIPNTLHGTQVSETYYLVRYWHYLIFERTFKNPIHIISISSIMHLILSLSASESTGTMKICEDQREATTMLRLLSDQSKQEVDSGLTHEKVQSNLFHYVHERPLTALIHLSCAKSVETHVGNKETHVDPKEGSTTNDVVQQYQELLICESVTKENEIVTNNILLQEEPPDQPSNQQTKLISKDTLTEDLSQVSKLLLLIVSSNSNDVIINLLILKECEKIVDLLNKSMELISCLRTYRVADLLCDILSESLCGKEMVQSKIGLLVYIDPMTVLMHLFLAQSVDELAGTNKEHMEHKGDSPEVRKVNDQIQNQSEPAPLMLTPSIMETRRVSNSCLIKEEPPDFKAQAQTREGFKQATRQLKAPDQNRGVILSFLLKGEPPDAPCTIKPPPYQGKTLASQNRMKANLLSLGADCIVSRSKLFQGRGYDADIQIKPNRDYTKPAGTCIKPIDMEHFGGFLPKWSPNQAQGLGLIIHQQINPKKTNDSSGGIKDQRAESPCWGNLTVALFFPYLGFVPMGLPRKVFNEATSSHQGIIYQEIDSKMLQVHIADVLADRPAALLTELLAELLSEVPHQMKPNKEIFLILYLDVPQSFIWRPGEYLDHLEASLHALRYTTPHLIKRINSELYLPYLDPIVINVPWIFPLLFERPLKIFQSIKKLPRRHNFLPKLTRYKAHLTCLIWTNDHIFF
ncbi:Zinc finger CCHC-type [Arabidopsis thaliana x Arabidopsis arenosa]|uniref:Zinc finger CCHC-type n=1 Tax=Arabidopsis thaliana x Arabidopsis arenosa TaxID=1240361 RepID=A0A8T1Z2D9_9BRAS|nr:Zinc finger CCHC-type [Arabidopsis thaliana x Arabidopsis arenosa]